MIGLCPPPVYFGPHISENRPRVRIEICRAVLIKTTNIKTVKYCQNILRFELPSVLLSS